MTVTTEAPTQEQTLTDTINDATAAEGAIKSTIKDKIGQHGSELKDQALSKAREYAAQGKEKATDVLDSVAKIVENTASTLDDKLGAAGGYVHNAADALTDFAESLRNKDFETLLDDAKAAVRRNPVIAIGAAAAVGFVMVRLIKSASGSSAKSAPANPDDLAI